MASGTASTSADPASASVTPAANSDVLASIITQVQPGQPVRQPVRQRPQGQKRPSAKSSSRPSGTGAAPSGSAPASPAIEAEAEKPKPPPVSTPAAPTKPPTQQRPASPRKKKRKPGFFESLLAFLTCSSPAVQEKNFKDVKASSSREATQLTKNGRQTVGSTEMKQIPPGTSVASAPTSAPAKASESSLPAKSVQPTEAVDAAALASQEAQANTSREGAALPRDETGDVLSGAVVPPGKEGGTPGRKKRRSRASTPALAAAAAAAGGTDEQDTSDQSDEEDDEEYAEEDEEDRLISQGGMGIPVDENGVPRPLLSELTPSDTGRKCLVLDLDETLVHSSFKMIHQADFVVPVEIENQSHNVYVIKRPGVDLFLQKMGEIYEVVVFTASLSKYADPVLDHLDIHRVVRHRLFRESCYNHRGNYVKDLSQLGRPIGETIIIDNSPASYIFHPKNAVPVSSWFNDPHDTELTDLLGVLTDLADVPDVRGVLDSYLETDTGFGLEQSMEQLSASAALSAQEHSSLQHQQQQNHA